MQKTLCLLLLPILIVSACTGPDTPGPDEIVRENGKVLIVDNTGKSWDVTHAEQVYGLKAENFEFGLGPFAIRPILDPQYCAPGEPAYPDTNDIFLVIGTEINGIERAYSINILSSYEVADENFDSTYVAVAY